MKEVVNKIYLRKDGRYEIRYRYGYKSDGTLKYKSVYGNTEEEVIQKLNIIIVKSDISLMSDKAYLGYDIIRWLNSAKIRCKKSTYSNYQYTINARIIPKFAMIKKKNISSEFIDEYTNELFNNGLSPKTIKDILIILQQILNIAELNIKVSMPRVPKNEIKILKKEEQEILERALINNLNEITFGIYLCLYTGLRIGELCALKISNIDIENKKIYIKKTITRIKNPISNSKEKTVIVIEDPKSESSIREIPIPNFIIPILKHFCKNKPLETFLVTGTEKFMETRTFFNKYKMILKEVHLEDYNFHSLRHTFATRCIESGCDPKTLSEILGHSSVKITLERYVHPNYENKVKMMNQLKPMYKN